MRKRLLFTLLPSVLSLSLLSTVWVFAQSSDKKGSISGPVTAPGATDLLNTSVSPAPAASDAESGLIESLADSPEPNAKDDGTLTPKSEEDSSVFASSSLISACADAEDDPEILSLLTSTQETILATKNVDGVWSSFLAVFPGGKQAACQDQRMPAASLIKLFIMGAVYENFDALSAAYGAETLNAKLKPMITVSDNDAANFLTECLGNGDSTAGMAVVNSYALAHGYTSTHMGRLLLAPNDKDDNYTSTRDVGIFLREIYESNFVEGHQSTLSHPDEMYALLLGQERRNKIPAKLPANVTCASKTGELSDVENDAAILTDDKGNALIMVFMSKELSAPAIAQGAISDAALSLYQTVTAS